MNPGYLKKFSLIAIIFALILAPNVGADWQIEVVDDVNGVGYFTSIALDSSGYPHISYLDLYPE